MDAIGHQDFSRRDAAQLVLQILRRDLRDAQRAARER